METNNVFGIIAFVLLIAAVMGIVIHSVGMNLKEKEAARWLWNHRRVIAKQLGAYNIRVWYNTDKCKLEMPRCDKETGWMSCYKMKKILRKMEKERPDYVFYEYAHDIKIEKPKDVPAESPPTIGASHGK